jgi:hypothetical protein
MEGIFKAIYLTDDEQGEQINLIALKALAEVPSVGYRHLNHYIQRIGGITF